MRRAVWITDPHLNFLKPQQVAGFFRQITATKADALLISGDIGEAHSVQGYLRQMADSLSMPVYFVLGNHDFYFGSIREVRRQVDDLCRQTASLNWLGSGQIAELAPGTGLVGHDGWADARHGDYERSSVMLNDCLVIAELAGHTKQSRLPLLRSLGDEVADHFRRTLPDALERYAHVVLVTHIPPFREACLYRGHVTSDEWLPHLACKAAGDAILEVMSNFPHRRLTVLCGHTHGVGETRPAPNVTVYIGGARYGEPEIQRVFELD